jgi:hypothetical protein
LERSRLGPFRRASLAIGAGAIVIIIVGAVVLNQGRLSADLSKHVQRSVTERGVELTTSLALAERSHVIDVVAKVEIINTGNTAQAYIGISCSNPVTVNFESTRPDPSGPHYSASGAALRSDVMQDRRSRDGGLTFSTDSSDKPSSTLPPCDSAAPPVLRPHERIAYTVSSPFAINGQWRIDAPTTDVVTRLGLGGPPAAQEASIATPIQLTDTIELRIPLHELSSETSVSRADLTITSQRFDVAMKNAALSAWVDAQDPSSWRAARLADSSTSASQWTLTAFNGQYAVPLLATGSGSAILNVQVPQEKVEQRPVSPASVPQGAVSGSTTWVPSRDIYVGDLLLPSGRVMVGDPVSSDEMVLFDWGLKAGRYPVHVVTARPRYLSEDWARPAWAVLMLSDEPVTHWAPAVPVGHSVKELRPGDAFTFATDSGTAGFASAESMARVDANPPLYESLGNREEANDYLWGLLAVDSLTGANVFACGSGFGDGGYPVVLGLDAQNRPARLLADFSMLDMDYGGIHAH